MARRSLRQWLAVAVLLAALPLVAVAQVQIFPNKLATAVKAFNGAASISKTSGRGINSVTYGAANFGGLDLSVTKTGCAVTGDNDSGYYVAPTATSGYFCTTSTDSCSYAQTFSLSSCLTQSGSGQSVASNNEFSVCCAKFLGICTTTYYWTYSPRFAYETATNLCPYGWTGTASTPWQYITAAPTVSGSCASYTYACTNPGIFFGIEPSATDAIVPYFAYSLSGLSGTASQRCITALTLQLTWRAAAQAEEADSTDSTDSSDDGDDTSGSAPSTDSEAGM